MTFNLIETLAFTAFGLFLGRALFRFFPVFDRLCLPEPVLGGLLLCGGFTAVKFFSGKDIAFDTTLQSPLMLAFFLSIGWMASWRELKRGGKTVISFLLFCLVALVTQNVIGMALAVAMGEPPLLGVLAGSVALTGGPGTALAFAPAFEKAGLEAAAAIGTASALAGIVIGGLMGSPQAARLISKYRLKPSQEDLSSPMPQDVPISMGEQMVHPKLAPAHLTNHLQFIIIVMALGAALGGWIQTQGVTLPLYIGAMAVAALVRNACDLKLGPLGRLPISNEMIEELGSVALAYFLVMATMTLNLGQLASMASVLVIILAVQAIWIFLVASILVFRCFGKDYDAAVIGAGFTGFMMGTMANAMANINAITRRYGPAPKAYLVVPIVGVCGVDFANSALITFLLAVFDKS
jgi:ESS family glutamate:Na+ symporter